MLSGNGNPPDPQKEFQVGESSVATETGTTRPALVPREGLGARQTGLGAKARDKMVLEFRVSIIVEM